MTDEERREWKRAYNHEYYRKNREQILERMHKQNAANPDKAREYSRKWKREHLEQRREYDRKYYARHREEISRKQREHQNERCLFYDAVKCRRSQHHCMTCGWNPKVKQQRKERYGDARRAEIEES